MQKTIRRLPKSEAEVSITVPWAQVQETYRKVLDVLSRSAQLPGFRPGKAPTSFVEDKVGKGKIWNETLERLLPATLFDALQGEEITVIGVPRYNITQYGEEKDVQYTATFSALPKIEVKDYSKIKVKKQKPRRIDDKQIEEVVQNLFKKWCEQKQEKKSDAQGAKTTFVDASGKPLFAQSAKISQLPDVPTDDFAKTLGAEDLTDLRLQVKKELEERAQFEAEKEYEDKLLMELDSRTRVELPEILVQDELNRMMIRLNQTLEGLRTTMDTFLQAQKKTVEDLRKDWRAQAQRNVRIELTLQEIGKQEKIAVSEQEIDTQLKDHGKHEGHDPERERAVITYALRQAKTLAWLKQNAAA